jgi:hydrogenase maturation factor
VCRAFGIDPLAAMASGALLLTAPPAEAAKIGAALAAAGLAWAEIGAVDEGPTAVWLGLPERGRPLARPARDEVARVFDRSAHAGG